MFAGGYRVNFPDEETEAPGFKPFPSKGVYFNY